MPTKSVVGFVLLKTGGRFKFLEVFAIKGWL